MTRRQNPMSYSTWAPTHKSQPQRVKRSREGSTKVRRILCFQASKIYPQNTLTSLKSPEREIRSVVKYSIKTSNFIQEHYVIKGIIMDWRWSICRFTYRYLVTTSPSSKRRGLINFVMKIVASHYFKTPKTLPGRSIGRSDGRCVQRAGT